MEEEPELEIIMPENNYQLENMIFDDEKINEILERRMRVVASYKKMIDKIFTSPIHLTEVKEVMFQELQMYIDISLDLLLTNGKTARAMDRMY